jgi:hypothetical protein
MFLRGEISREDFLGQLVHPKQNHQICFCTLNSLQMLDYVDSGIPVTGMSCAGCASMVENIVMRRECRATSFPHAINCSVTNKKCIFVDIINN